MSFPPVYLSEIPGCADPELLAALDAIASAPESLPLEEGSWETALALIEQHIRAERKSRGLPTTGKNVRRGWIQIDTTSFTSAGANPFSFHAKPPLADASALLFPAILERDASPWTAPDVMLGAVRNRPEVRPLFDSGQWLDGPQAAVLKFLTRADPRNPEDEDAAEMIRSVIDGRAIDSEHYVARAILAALSLGRSIGRAEIIEEAASEIRHGIKMEKLGNGKNAKGLSEYIDEAIATLRLQGLDDSLPNVRGFLRITVSKGKTSNEIHSADARIEQALQDEKVTKNPDILNTRLKQRRRAVRRAARGH